MDYINHITLIAILCLTSLFSYSQTITGTIEDFETNAPLDGAVILEDKSVNGSIIDSLGNFKIVIEGANKTLKCSFVGYYELVIKNIPTTSDKVELGSLKMVKNYSSHLIVEFAPDIEPDMEKYKLMKAEVAEKYRIKLFGNTYEPTVLDNQIVFNLNEYN